MDDNVCKHDTPIKAQSRCPYVVSVVHLVDCNCIQHLHPTSLVWRRCVEPGLRDNMEAIDPYP
jgi:hypothetical protein